MAARTAQGADAGFGRDADAGFGRDADAGFGRDADARFGRGTDARFGRGADARFGPRADDRFGPRPMPDRPPGDGRLDADPPTLLDAFHDPRGLAPPTPPTGMRAPALDQDTGPRRAGRHGAGPGRGADALAPGQDGGRGRRGRPEQMPPPGREARTGRDVLPGPGAVPGRDTMPGRGMPPGSGALPGRDGPPGRDGTPGRDGIPGRDGPRRGAPRRRDASPGRDEAGRSPGRSAGRRRAPGWDEARAADAGTAVSAAFADPADPAAGRPRRRPGSRGAVPDLAADHPGRGSRAARSGARASRRRIRAVLLAVVVLAVLAAGAFAAMKFLSRAAGRSHVLVTPSRLGSYVRRPNLEQQMNARALQQQLIAKSAGQASHVVSAVYENSAGVSGAAAPQIFLFIGGNLAGESPAGFISSFTAQFRGARGTGAGSQGGQAACVAAQGSAAGSVALCTWADGDTFGVVTSPTMSLTQLAAQMRAIRPSVELPAR